jgi:hypothetical protein
MDYSGQKLSEWIYYIITIGFGVVAWIVGTAFQSFLGTRTRADPSKHGLTHGPNSYIPLYVSSRTHP